MLRCIQESGARDGLPMVALGPRSPRRPERVTLASRLASLRAAGKQSTRRSAGGTPVAAEHRAAGLRPAALHLVC